jgi:signal transduction histidine kinase
MPFQLHTFRRAAYVLLACGALALWMLLDQYGSPGNLLPHGYCFTWNPALLWTHVASDTLIGLAYVSIPLTLLHLVRRRTDMPFNWIVLLFASFIVSCGATHWIEVWTVWTPDYWLSAAVKVVTATASVLTAAALVYLVPHILAIPTVAQLTAAKEALEAEVRHRRAVEEELRRERAELEHRVEVRTSELGEAIASEKAALARAEEASLQKDRFLAKVSHELRTPLQSTLSWSQVLRMTDVTREQAALAAERIVHNVRSQARLIDDLLDISRILSGKLGLEWQEADVMAVVEKAVEVVRAGARSKAVDIEVVHELDDPHLLTDPVRLEQIVWNLVSNAVHASLKGGVVLVTLRLDGPALRIDVQDWGQGIAPEDLPQLFEPFRQGLRSENTHRGLGLGLAITRNIATLFGGELSVRSSGLGQGACFTVKLPLQTFAWRHEPGAGTGLKLRPEELGRLRGLRVLYVEDEPDIAEGGRLMLSGLGAQVSVCLSFDEARRRVAEGGFDVLLSDLSLDNNRSGNELLRFLRGLPHGKELPALLLSAYGSEEEQRISREAGFVLHLVKPAGAEDVARALLASLPPTSS